jgi:hypothetical protein
MENLASKLSAAELSLLKGVGEADLASQGPLGVQLLQSNSPHLVEDSKEYLGELAKAGMYAVPHAGEWLLVKEFILQLIAFTRAYLEWLAGRGGFVASHAEKPGDAVWLAKGQRHPTWDLEDVGVERAGFWRANTNKVEEVISAHGLISNVGLTAPIAGVLGFRSTSLAVGRELADRSQRLRIEGEEIKGIVLGKWKVTSRLEKRDDYRWHLPVVTLVGKFGEATGPTLVDTLLAARLRQAFKQGETWEPPGEPPVPPPPPPIAHATTSESRESAGRHGSIEVNGRPVSGGRRAFAQYEDADYGGPRSRDEIDDVDF